MFVCSLSVSLIVNGKTTYSIWIHSSTFSCNIYSAIDCHSMCYFETLRIYWNFLSYIHIIQTWWMTNILHTHTCPWQGMYVMPRRWNGGEMAPLQPQVCTTDYGPCWIWTLPPLLDMASLLFLCWVPVDWATAAPKRYCTTSSFVSCIRRSLWNNLDDPLTLKSKLMYYIWVPGFFLAPNEGPAGLALPGVEWLTVWLCVWLVGRYSMLCWSTHQMYSASIFLQLYKWC